MTRFQRRRETHREIRRTTDSIPLPKHPFRDSAIFYAVLSAILLAVTYVTDGEMLRAGLVAAGFFVVGTAFTWLRFRKKLAERDRGAGPQ